MTTITPDWPDDADGGVFRRLVEHGFDFAKPYSVDYNVDFDSWPPQKVAIELLDSLYGPVTIYNPDEHGDGYVQFKINALVTYEGVTSVQRNVSTLMEPYGGICESWGVMQDAP
jgi:Regulator of ribonuclease activity B